MPDRVGSGSEKPSRVFLNKSQMMQVHLSKWQQMKPTILLLALLSPITVRAQTPAQAMTDKLCDQRGKIYVTDKNKDESVPEPGRSFYWSFLAAHYDSRTNSCYVMYDRLVSGLGTVLEQLKIDDIEGNRVAGNMAERGGFEPPVGVLAPTTV